MSQITNEVKNQIKKRRTFAIISHPDAGKTTLTEKFLLYGGAINQAGSVKGKATAKHAVSDWMEIEKERGISVTSSVLQFNYDGYCINILDTPGHQDFSEDTYRTLMAADSAVMVIDASKGVEAQTRKLFKVCTMRHIPIFTFINKMDREAMDTFELLDDIENELGIATCPINWSIGSGKEFKGVYDRASKKVEIFSDTKKGTTQGEVKKVDINDPEISWLITDDQKLQLEEEIELQDGAGAEFDQELVSKGELSPVFFGSALTNFGVETFTISAGLETGVLTGNENYVCGGVMHVGDHDIHCSNRSGHGPETLKQALENSCNVALMQIGASIGTEEFCRYQRLFGFGEYTGIDLPGEGETSGLLYTPATMDPASLATNAFGQNFNVTMTQMAASFSSLINGGNYYEPHVVKQIQDDNGNVTENKDPVLVKKTISKETSDIIKDYMLGVVEEGTGASAAVEGYAVGGKTGTAEKLPRGNGKYLVSFIGYAPQENPQVMVYVVIDEPNSAVQANSGYATQLASQIMTDIFPYLGIEKKTDSASNTDTQTTQTAQQ